MRNLKKEQVLVEQQNWQKEESTDECERKGGDREGREGKDVRGRRWEGGGVSWHKEERKEWER